MAELIPISQLPSAEGPVVRHSVLGAAVFTLVMLLMSLLPIGYGGFGEILPQTVEIPSWLVYAFSALWSLMALMGAAFWRRGLGPQNWRVRLGTHGLFINLRSHLNSGFAVDDPVVLDLPFSDIYWFRKTRERGSSPGTDTGRELITFYTYLDLKVSPKVAETVRQGLESERARIEEYRKKQWVARHFPVSVPAGDMLRITWNGLRPGLSSFRKRLAGKVVEEPELYIRKADWMSLSGADLEERILDLAAQGREIEAVSLIRQKFGNSLTEARQFLAELKKS